MSECNGKGNKEKERPVAEEKQTWLEKVEEGSQELKNETQQEFRREHNAHVEDLLRADDIDTSAASKRF